MENTSINESVSSSSSEDNTSIESNVSSDTIDGSQYTKVSHEEHVMLVPDTYVGSIEPEVITRNVLVVSDNGEKSIKSQEVKIVPAYFKIFDEVLVNAADHWSRLESYKQEGKDIKHSLTEIKVTLNQSTGEIIVYNNGEGIDVVYLEEYGIYPPELIFGSLLTGTNYDTDLEKTWGGRNGYGAKLANIFSTQFIVETVDWKRGLKFTQKFSNNMKTRDEPTIVKSKCKPYTKISFIPDYQKFSLQGLDSDHLSLFRARVYDIAAWTDKRVSVHLDGEKIETTSFENYVDLYLGSKEEKPRNFLKINNRWEIVVTHSDDDTFQQVSLVNGINTCRGGKHVEYIADQIKEAFVQLIQKKKKLDVKGTREGLRGSFNRTNLDLENKSPLGGPINTDPVTINGVEYGGFSAKYSPTEPYIQEGNQKSFSFITSIGLFDANDELLAVAKLSRPVEKNDEKDLTFNVRLDF